MSLRIIQRINTIGILPTDESLLANKKRFVVYESILMSFGGIMWGTLCLLIERHEQSVIPFGYVVLSAINIALFSKFKWFAFTQGFQTGISLLLPFLFQWYLGGFYASGGVMLWALLSLAASLSYSNTRASIVWLITYVALTVFSGYYDSTFAAWFPFECDMSFSIGLISMNIAVVSTLIFVLVIFYVNENSNSYAKVKDAQQMLIQSEKLAALGQLSAGIAHEINTPLGAIKAIAQESKAMGNSLVNNLLELYRKLSEEEIKLLLELIEKHKVKKEFLTTREERPLRMVLQKELEAANMEHASLLANKLCQINIYEIDRGLERFIGPNFHLIVDVLHLLFLEQKNNYTTLTSVEKASRIVRALKMYLHSSEANTPERFNLRESLDTVLTIYHNQIKHGIRVAIDVPEQIEMVGYSEEIGQVWTNLIVNACQAMDFSGTLVIKAALHASHAHITISDTGCGIPQEIGDKIFDAFYSTKKIGEGSGLGLDIVKNIVLKHNGKIYYESTIDSGTTFHVILPLKFEITV
jgi:signal transduction histidine kinase